MELSQLNQPSADFIPEAKASSDRAISRFVTILSSGACALPVLILHSPNVSLKQGLITYFALAFLFIWAAIPVIKINAYLSPKVDSSLSDDISWKAKAFDTSIVWSICLIAYCCI